MIFPADRDELRRMYLQAWQRHRDGLPLEPLQAQIANVVAAHPEYQPLLESGEDVIDRDWLPEQGLSNPFLHMGMHLAVREQLSTDRPRGIVAVHRGLVRQFGDAHEAEHRMAECLAEALWRSQRSGLPPDEDAYLDALRGL
ncbi:MAG: DUF1841 family protein [Gammaproteobacteria bacterium]|jgi:hypothetical protein